MNALEIVKRAAGAAIATDEKCRILSWNRAARELLGYDDAAVVHGKLFRDVLEARDIFGNRLSKNSVPFYEMVTRGHMFRLRRALEIQDSTHPSTRTPAGPMPSATSSSAMTTSST